LNPEEWRLLQDVTQKKGKNAHPKQGSKSKEDSEGRRGSGRV
jgi:hypothetical protein